MIKIKSSDHSIWIGIDCFSKLELTKYSKVGILVDENTKKHCLPKFPKTDNIIIIEIKSGEENKNLKTCEHIWQQLTNNEFDRKSVLINLGGGVIGDIGGFSASTYKRGIPFINIPTTLIAMTDASIGGKLGVDFKYLKNHIGLFKNPKAIFINPKFLETLENNVLISGFSETIKHALIANKNLWKKISESNIQDLNLLEIIKSSVKIKNDIVIIDPLDDNKRKQLNFGHTFAHAIESYYLQKKSPILHGEAVLMGIILESEISVLSNDEKNEIKSYILNNFKLPYTPSKKELIKYMTNDKKNSEDKINLSLLEGIGKCSINNLFNINEL